MKCPQCAAWSSVKETRDIRRRRECANGHLFTTNEIAVLAQAEAQKNELADFPAGHQFAIGIDPGVNTGFAAWDLDAKKFVRVESLMLHEAFGVVQNLHSAGMLWQVTFEDARLRTWFSSKGREALQGAGSVKRDSKAWEEMLTAYRIPFKAVSPEAKGRKVASGVFSKLTGWNGRSNEHGRDAAMLVFGMKRPAPARINKDLEIAHG